MLKRHPLGRILYIKRQSYLESLMLKGKHLPAIPYFKKESLLESFILKGTASWNTLLERETPARIPHFRTKTLAEAGN